jgi:heme oxygenase (biliverdin-producing, ferredoxin)
MISLADELREHTRELHTRVESSGIVREILGGRVTLRAYAMYLRNLLGVYESLERALTQRRTQSRWQVLASPSLQRTSHIAADLAALSATVQDAQLPLLAATAVYRARIDTLANRKTGEMQLAAHAYTRHLGDLSGGRILARILSSALSVPPSAVSCYQFPAIADIEQFKGLYRSALGALPRGPRDRRAMLDEAATAFELNIALSDAVYEASRDAEGFNAAAC